MNCPTCGVEMVEGEASVRGTLLGSLFVGFSHQHLFFKRKKNRDGNRAMRKKILSSGRTTRAYHCEKCRLTVLKK